MRKRKLIYFGTPSFALPPLQALIADQCFEVVAVITQPDQPSGRGKKRTAPPVKKLAEASEIPVLQPTSLRREWDRVREELLRFSPTYDAAVVCAFGQILPSPCLEFPKLGCINIHASLLPRWRGAAPIQRAIMAGDRETGVSLMQMEAGLDTGPWYVQEKIPITDSSTAGSLHDELSTLGARMLTEHLEAILEGSRPAIAQDSAQVTYAEKLTRSEALLDWTASAQQLARVIRALSPSPGAYTFLLGKRLKVLLAVPVSPMENRPHDAPGSIFRVDDRTLEIACGDGILSLTELQWEGRAKLKTPEFLKGTRLEPGMQLTNSSGESNDGK